MNINNTINENRRRKLSILYKNYKNAWNIINDKKYKFSKYEKEYETATKERRRELLNILPNDTDYFKAYTLYDTLKKELGRREIEDFFTKNGLLDGNSAMFNS